MPTLSRWTGSAWEEVMAPPSAHDHIGAYESEVAYVQLASSTTVAGDGTPRDITGLTTGAVALAAGTYMVDVNLMGSNTTANYGYFYVQQDGIAIATQHVPVFPAASDDIAYPLRSGHLVLTAASYTFKVQFQGGSGTLTVQSNSTKRTWLRVTRVA